jgi:probable phosphoglycerate mutase
VSTTIHFIRHGDTTASSDGVFCGELDLPLAPSGLAQAEKLAAKVTGLGPLHAIYVSNKIRARTTAEPTARATGLTPHVEEGLREIAYGSWDGRSETEIRAHESEAYALWADDPGTHSPPGGENGLVIAARAMPVVARILVEHKDQTVAVFSHKATIRILTCFLLGIEVSRFRDRVACPTASITTFAFGPRGPMIHRLGEAL